VNVKKTVENHSGYGIISRSKTMFKFRLPDSNDKCPIFYVV